MKVSYQVIFNNGTHGGWFNTLRLAKQDATRNDILNTVSGFTIIKVVGQYQNEGYHARVLEYSKLTGKYKVRSNSIPRLSPSEMAKAYAVNPKSFN